MNTTLRKIQIGDTVINVAIVAPGVNDDISAGYGIGSIWFDSLSSNLYICTNSSNGAAVWADILGVLATVAFTGAYGDLSGTPTLGTAAAENVGFFATAAQGATADTALQPNAVSGNFTTVDGKTVTVVDGQITSIV